MFCIQNPEPAVEFDTVANKKQQHEVNVGKFISFSLSHVGEFRFSLLFLTPFMQLSQIHSDLEGTTLWWYLHLSNHDLGSLFLPWANWTLNLTATNVYGVKFQSVYYKWAHVYRVRVRRIKGSTERVKRSRGIESGDVKA
ncbi:hypothetical protein BHE74_00030319 [Ensete ventricosum]|nr:hypothetical protein BHE74_00030319 [Ensete ventricosum]